MPVLDDGTIVPHYFGVDPIGVTGGNAGLKTNVSLRVGEVKEIVYPTDQKSVSKTWTEYRVEVQHKDAYHPGTVTTYSNCWVVNVFGGVADRCTYTLRADTGGSDQPTGGTGLGTGSKVLLLCINGDQPNAIILGGIRDTQDTPDQKSDGHHLSWSFNGIAVEIDDTGELQVVFNGATNVDGSPRSDVKAGAAGSTLKFSDDGSVTVSQGDQKIVIDTPGKNVTVTSGDYNVKIDASGTKLGDPSAVDAIIKGTTFRAAQQVLHTTLSTALTTLSGLLATAGAALASAAVPNAIPIVGGAIAAPFFITAGTAIASASAAVATMVAAIQTFEAAEATYLSLQNFTS